jgi:hypothetical protein
MTLGKFYLCIEADEVTQHVQRVLWKFGNTRKEPEAFTTTQVNYGYIVIAAVRETEERFSGGKEEVTWFQRDRTYEDDATGGATKKKQQ